tara:strand:+ start:29 stop:262 length:234 start_codon:yes stop_codon:yes gene_type:complete
MNVKESSKIKDLKELREKIKGLEFCENIEILKIIIKNDIKFTENSNGIFVNMNKLDENTLNEIKSFLSFINNNLNKI